MELKISLEELKDLSKICVPKSSIYINIEISESAAEYCRKALEGQYKFQTELLQQPLKLENDTLYKKLCKEVNKNETKRK